MWIYTRVRNPLPLYSGNLRNHPQNWEKIFPECPFCQRAHYLLILTDWAQVKKFLECPLFSHCCAWLLWNLVLQKNQICFLVFIKILFSIFEEKILKIRLTITNTVKLSLFKRDFWKLPIPNRDLLKTLWNIYDDHLCLSFKHLSCLGLQINHPKISQAYENVLQTFTEHTGKASKPCWKAIITIPDLCASSALLLTETENASYLNISAFLVTNLEII